MLVSGRACHLHFYLVLWGDLLAPFRACSLGLQSPKPHILVPTVYHWTRSVNTVGLELGSDFPGDQQEGKTVYLYTHIHIYVYLCLLTGTYLGEYMCLCTFPYLTGESEH